MTDTLTAAALALIAAWVSMGLSQKRDMWRVIVLYWLTLAARNILLLGGTLW